MSEPIAPGAVLGVLGGGQLGRMFAAAAQRMGYRVHVLADSARSPAGQLADVELVAPYDDVDAVVKLASGVSAVTFEFENVSAACLDAAARVAPCRPSGSVLFTTQHRVREKAFLRRVGVPVAAFAVVRSAADVEAALRSGGVPAPAVLKTAASGYDGKGQVLVRRLDDAAPAWATLRADEAVLEAFVDFTSEASVIVARGADGACAFYGPVENRHANHILDTSHCPADRSDAVAADAREIARLIAAQIGLVGVLCVEMFVLANGRLLVNELAPRPHNSGHLTIEACAASQFEQQVRTLCGLPLGDAAQRRPAAMANLLGDMWSGGEPEWTAVDGHDALTLHLYGKDSPRAGRKMGHLTALADTADAALARVVNARRRLTPERGV